MRASPPPLIGLEPLLAGSTVHLSRKMSNAGFFVVSTPFSSFSC